MYFTYICCTAERSFWRVGVFSLTYVQCLQRWNIVAIVLPVRILNTYFPPYSSISKYLFEVFILLHKYFKCLFEVF